VLELQRLEGEMTKRLADAGRLRPTQKFDDVLSGLGAHIVGFLTLVFAWGLLIDPINRAIFSFFYDNHFDAAWDDVRPIRQTPGQDAYDKWLGKRRSVEESGEETSPLKSNPSFSLSMILVFLFLAGLVVFLWNPHDPNPPRLGTVICASARTNPDCEGGSVTVTATVIGPGSADVPSGTVEFSTKGDSHSRGQTVDSQGVAIYKTHLEPGSHTISAKYKGSSNFEESNSVTVAENVQKLQPSKRAPKPPCLGVSNADLSTSTLSVETPTNCLPVVPNLPTPVLPPFWPLFYKSIAVTLLAIGVAFLLPGVLKKLAPTPVVDPTEKFPSKKEVKAFKKSSSEEMETGLTSDQEHTRDLVEDLANGLLQELKTLASTGEQELADKFAQQVAAGLLSKLQAMKNPSSSNEEQGEDSRTPSATEQKLAEDLVQKLVEDIQNQPNHKEDQPNDAQKLANELIQQLSKDLVTKLAKGPMKPLTCEQKLAKLWEKLSQPQYAIGQGLMARSDFEALQNSYYSQSLISSGSMLPLFLLVLAVLLTPQFALGGHWIFVTLGLGEVLLLITGVDRRHKYLAELDSLISSAFLKACEQNEKSATDKSSKSVAVQIAEALKAAKIVKLTKYEVEPGDTTKPPTGSGPGGGSTLGPTGSASKTPSEPNRDDLDAAQAAQDREELKKKLADTNLRLRPGAAPVPAPPPTPAPSSPPAPGKTVTPPGTGAQKKPGGSGESEP